MYENEYVTENYYQRTLAFIIIIDTHEFPGNCVMLSKMKNHMTSEVCSSMNCTLQVLSMQKIFASESITYS